MLFFLWTAECQPGGDIAVARLCDKGRDSPLVLSCIGLLTVLDYCSFPGILYVMESVREGTILLKFIALCILSGRMSVDSLQLVEQTAEVTWSYLYAFSRL